MIANYRGGASGGEGGTVKGVVVEVDYLAVMGESEPFWLHFNFLFECVRMVFPQLNGFHFLKFAFRFAMFFFLFLLF